jgi:hypothetical protein
MLGPWALGALWTGIAAIAVAMDQAQSPLPTEGARRRERTHATAGGRAIHTQESGAAPPSPAVAFSSHCHPEVTPQSVAAGPSLLT